MKTRIQIARESYEKAAQELYNAEAESARDDLLQFAEDHPRVRTIDVEIETEYFGKGKTGEVAHLTPDFREYSTYAEEDEVADALDEIRVTYLIESICLLAGMTDEDGEGTIVLAELKDKKF